MSSSFDRYTPIKSIRYIEVKAQFHRESSELKRERESNFDHETESENDSESDFDLTIVTMLSDFEFTEESIDISDFEFDIGLIQDHGSKTEQISVSNLDSDSLMFSVMPIRQQNTSNDACLSEYSSKYSDVEETSKSEESKIDEIISNQETDFEPNACSEMATEQTQNTPEMLLHVPTTSPVTGGTVFDTTVGLEQDLESESRLVHDSEYEANPSMVSESSTITEPSIEIKQNLKSDTESKVNSEISGEFVKPDCGSSSELESPRNKSKSVEEREDSAENADQGTLEAEEESACKPNSFSHEIPNGSSIDQTFEYGKKRFAAPSREAYLCAQVVAAVVGTVMGQLFRELAKPENVYHNAERHEKRLLNDLDMKKIYE